MLSRVRQGSLLKLDRADADLLGGTAEPGSSGNLVQLGRMDLNTTGGSNISQKLHSHPRIRIHTRKRTSLPLT